MGFHGVPMSVPHSGHHLCHLLRRARTMLCEVGTLTTWKPTFPLDLCDEVAGTLMSPKDRHGGSFVQAHASF